MEQILCKYSYYNYTNQNWNFSIEVCGKIGTSTEYHTPNACIDLKC